MKIKIKIKNIKGLEITPLAETARRSLNLIV